MNPQKILEIIEKNLLTEEEKIIHIQKPSISNSVWSVFVIFFYYTCFLICTTSIIKITFFILQKILNIEKEVINILIKYINFTTLYSVFFILGLISFAYFFYYLNFLSRVFYIITNKRFIKFININSDILNFTNINENIKKILENDYFLLKDIIYVNIVQNFINKLSNTGKILIQSKNKILETEALDSPDTVLSIIKQQIFEQK